MRESKSASRKGHTNNPHGRPVTVEATEVWMMRVNPVFHATLMRKAKEWGISGAELVRLVVQEGFDEELFEPPVPGELIRDRLRRERKERSARGEGPDG